MILSSNVYLKNKKRKKKKNVSFSGDKSKKTVFLEVDSNMSFPKKRDSLCTLIFFLFLGRETLTKNIINNMLHFRLIFFFYLKRK